MNHSTPLQLGSRGTETRVGGNLNDLIEKIVILIKNAM